MEMLVIILLLLILNEMRGEGIPPTSCRICYETIRWQKEEWIHVATGDHWGPFPKLNYELQPDLPLHPATPLSREVYFR